MVKVSRVIEAKNVSHVYMGWSDELKLTVEGGQLEIKLDESSLRAIATVVNDKIAEQDKEKAEAVAEAAREALAEIMEDDES
jgi:hypothetical protein